MVERERSVEKKRLDLGLRIVLLIGPEGSGKTENGKKLAKDSGKPYITTGGILRDLAANDPGPLGDKCRKMFNEHVYLDGPTLLQVLINRFRRKDVADGFVLDGGLRTIEETIDFPEMLQGSDLFLPLDVVYLKIPKEVSHERLVDGPSARKRSDDTTKDVDKRLEKFNLNLEERLDFIRKQKGWRLIEIDATSQIDQVYTDIIAAIV